MHTIANLNKNSKYNGQDDSRRMRHKLLVESEEEDKNPFIHR